MKTKQLGVLITVLSFSLLFSCKEKKAEAAAEVFKVRTELATSAAVEQTEVYTSTLLGEAVNSISPSIPVRIKKILVEVGDRVVRGQKLVEMDAANLQQQRVQLEKIERDLQRYQELYEAGGISLQQLEQMRVQRDVSKTMLDNLQENTFLLSPINGIVTTRNYDNGDMFGQMPVLVVQQLTPVKALINISEQYYPLVKRGMQVKVSAEAYPEQSFQGRLKLVHPTIDPVSHTFVCEVEIDNKNQTLRPGMFVRVSVSFGIEQRVLVPDVAVVKQAGANDRFVYVVEQGSVDYRKVEVGQRLGDKWVILEGVQAEEEVVTAGQNNLIKGVQVEIIKH